jgi:hypothetical protein
LTPSFQHVQFNQRDLRNAGTMAVRNRSVEIFYGDA